MQTITVWLLVALSGSFHQQSNIPTVKIDQFATQVECQRVAWEIKKIAESPSFNGTHTQNFACIQASVVR